MTSKKITEADIAELKIASLPSRPTAPRSFGGAGYTATQMKQAFDRLPLYLVARYNELIDDLTREGDEGAAAAIPTGISEGHTLADMTADVLNGAFAAYLNVMGAPLTERLSALTARLGELEGSINGFGAEDKLLLEGLNDLAATVESLGLSLEDAESRLEEGEARAIAIEEKHTEDIAALEEARAAEVAALKSELACPQNITIDCGGPSALVG